MFAENIGIDRKKFWFFFIIIALITTLNYLPFSNLSFNPDDFAFVSYGYQVSKSPLKLFTLRISDRDLRIFPVLSLSLTYSFFKTDPLAYHIVNLVVHIICLPILMYVLYLILGDLFLSSVHLLFAIYYPTGVVVIYPTSIVELCLMFFGLLSFLFYIKYSTSGKNYLYLLSLLFFLCAIFSKETAIVFAIILLFYRLLIYQKSTSKSF